MLIKDYKFHFLLHSAHLLEERLRVRLSPLGVQPRQARILDALGRMRETSQVRLANEFGLTAASMSTMTSRLLKAGLIEKRIDEQETRSNILNLTERGKKLLVAIHREWRKMDLEICDAIGAENAESLGDLACQLRNVLGGHTPGHDKRSAV